MSDTGNFSWDGLSRMYEELRKIPPNERDAWIEKNCPDEWIKEELYSLLQVDEDSADYFDSLTSNVISPALDELSDLPPASGKVYNYKLLRKIGRGGMGNVYLAERDDDMYKSRVAVKILRRGMDSKDILERFHTERQILARLNHPNITHLLDGGITSDGRPYFVMEYVQGKPITEYCDEKKLPVNERIELFNQICDALAFAHQNLVIHRDLKPRNILVTDQGNVKLLDFGIAKIVDNESSQNLTLSDSNERLMTPEYASPEQVRGATVNTASDVYQLGLVLYKLLSGKTPFDFENKSLLETERLILTQIPQKPSSYLASLTLSEMEEISHKRKTNPNKLIRKLKGDLDLIILTAIQKEPEQRFTSVLEFRRDIERYKRRLPVRSRGNRFGYKTIKYIQRNKLFLAIAAVFLIMLTSFSVFYNFSITEQRNQAQNEAEKAAQVTSFLMELFEANDPSLSQGEELTAWQLLQNAEERIELLENQPEIQAQMFDVTGQIYRRMGDFDRAEEFLNRALDLRISLYGPNHSETLAVYDQLGLLYSDTGNFVRADSMLRHALAIRFSQSSPNDPALSDTKTNLAYVLRRTGDYTEAERLYRNSYDIRKRHYGENHPSTIENLSSLGVTMINKGDYLNSESVLRQVLELRRNTLGSNHPDLAMSLNNLGAVLLNIGLFSEAESLFRESLEMRQHLFGDLHPKVALSMNNLGIALREQNRYVRARDYLLEALEIRKYLLGRDNVNTAISKFSLGQLKLQSGEVHSALDLLQHAHEIFEKHLSDSHSFTARTKMAVGSCYMEMGESELAENFITSGYEKVMEIHHESSLEMALADWELGTFFQNRGEYDKASEHLQGAYDTLQKVERGTTFRQEKVLAQRERISSGTIPVAYEENSGQNRQDLHNNEQ